MACRVENGTWITWLSSVALLVVLLLVHVFELKCNQQRNDVER